MSPRKNRRDTPEKRSGGAGWAQRTEEGADGEWHVRSIAGANATKPYRCPGCDQEIPPGVAHVVAWPADERGGADERRHWHRPCWEARNRRSPRGVPRY